MFNQKSGGFTFGSSNPPSTGTSSGFTFGNAAQTPAAGFPSGSTPATCTASVPSSNFSFSSAAASTSTPAAASSFQFGGFGSTASATPLATAGGLGSNAPKSGFGTSLGMPTATSSAPAPGTFSFQTPAPSTAGFSMSAIKPAAPTVQGGFSLGGATSTTTPTMSGFGSLPGSTTAPTISAPQPALGQQSALGTTLSAPAQTGGFKLGGPATALTTGGTGTSGFSLLGSTTTSGLGAGLAKPLSTGTATTGVIASTLGGTTAAGTTGLSLASGSKAITTGGFSIPAPSAASAARTIATATTSTSLSSGSQAAVASRSTPQMSYKQLEEQINKWASDLEEYERTFLDQASQVNAWDRLLMENGEKITELNSNVEGVKAEQKRLDEELDFILAQQQELEVLLKPLEEELKKRSSGSGQLQHADREREFTYGLAKDIDGQLKQMVGDLKAIIDHLNAAGTTQQNTNDPIVQVAKILNAHMNSLQWIDQNAGLLQRKVDEVSSLSEIRRKEQERNFRLAFD